MIKKAIIVLFSLAISFLVGVSPVYALSESLVPNFPSCTSPTGTLKVSYPDGTHGIVGNTGTFVGSDAVYIIGDSNLTQCFCAAGGSGIQTNWWKVGSLSLDQIKALQADGWIYVPTGSPWGLEDSAYFAKNISYSCNGGNNGGGNGGGGSSDPGAPVCNSVKPVAPVVTSIVRSGTSATITWTKVTEADHYVISYGTTPGSWLYGVPNTGNVTTFTINALDPNTRYYFVVRAVNNCMPSDESSTGQVLGAATGQVLGLANTGDSALVITIISLACLTLALSVLARRHQRAH